MEEKNPIQVSERIFHTIECLARTGPIGLLELSKELNLNKSTVHRILNLYGICKAGCGDTEIQSDI